MPFQGLEQTTSSTGGFDMSAAWGRGAGDGKERGKGRIRDGALPARDLKTFRRDRQRNLPGCPDDELRMTHLVFS